MIVVNCRSLCKYRALTEIIRGLQSNFHFSKKSSPEDMFLNWFWREGKRERETSMWEIRAPQPRWNLQPRCVLWSGVKPTTFWFMGRHSNQLSHPARAQIFTLEDFPFQKNKQISDFPPFSNTSAILNLYLSICTSRTLTAPETAGTCFGTPSGRESSLHTVDWSPQSFHPLFLNLFFDGHTDQGWLLS